MRKFLLLSVAAGLLWSAPAPAAEEVKEVKKEATETKKAGDKPMLAVFRLHGSITESPAQEAIPFFTSATVSFKDVVERLNKAAHDAKVKAVVLLVEGAGLGWAQSEELRQALAHLRKHNKEIYVHADNVSLRDYVLMSGATRISAVPTCDLWITGLYGEGMYLRGLLDLLGVKPDFLTCGEYKSAAEMFMRKGPSPAAEKMQNWLLDSTFDTVVRLIARGRNVTADQVRKWIDEGPYTAEKAKKAGIIDAVEERQDFVAMLKKKFGNDLVFNKKYGAKKQPKIDFSSPFAMFRVLGEMMGETKKKKPAKDAVAIVYVEGPIMLGGSEGPSLFGSEVATSTAVRKALDEAARDPSVKAVVLRVNSPGGSATASDIILDATKRVKAKKPFIVSMGNVAGSGGYYVACGSDLIYADRATITGSIGVVGGKLATTEMWKKIGVTFHEYKRGKNAGILSTATVFSPEERTKIQGWMDEIYGVFKDHVIAARGKRLKKPIDDLAGGRVYTGQQALELGLVDKIATLEDAIKHVAGQAKIKDYEVRVIPKPKNFLEILLEEAAGGKDEPGELELSVRRRLPLRSSPSLVDLALPHLKHLDPQRVRLVRDALLRLQLIQQEGVCLMMGEVRIGN